MTAPAEPSSALARWSDRFRAAAALTLDALPTLTADSLTRFADELGHRRACDRPFLAYLHGLDPGPPPPPPPPLPPPRSPALPSQLALTDDAPLWWLLHASPADASARLDSALTPGPVAAAPALAQPTRTIEVATESELAAVHALDLLSTRLRRPDLARRAQGAAAWLIEHIQPDNATTHPWAAHVFVRLGAEGGSAEALLYADTLTHNAMVALGRPDRLSAHVLLSCARALS
ncbi:MAG: hypothetical protein C0513_00695 [Isosphaera sp.]|nr:hypothetical protein [Isosphaera sp.]